MDKESIRLLAKTNLRGLTSSFLVCEIQAMRVELECDDDEERHFYLLCRFDYYLNELERRSHLNEHGIKTTNSEIIQTIKESIDIITVLDWYTEVIHHHGKYTYRCTLHGADNHPSGAIYTDTNKCWCFVCNKGGDIFDVVQLWERMELIDAIKKLANFIGLEIKPFEKKTTDSDERLRQVELKTNHLLRQPSPPTSPHRYNYSYNEVTKDTELVTKEENITEKAVTEAENDIPF